MLPASKVQLTRRDLRTLIPALPFPDGFEFRLHLRKSSGVPETLHHPTLVITDPEEPPAPRVYFPETWLWDLVPVG